ncbi:hypothetical protein EV424DRAFT_1378817 [Suillus variegatus]|nr:hypothetical protein EV424DRAFT_1378817 [Suillus variegatus]
MTVMYLGVRYIGMIYAIICVLVYVPTISVTDASSNSTETQTYSGFSEIFMLTQMFVLGPRLILNIMLGL